MAVDGRETPIDPGTVDRTAGTGPLSRMAQGVKFLVTGKAPDAWFGAGQPLQVIAPPEVAGRKYDFPTFINTSAVPRGETGENAITFLTLRRMAEPAQGGFDLLRLAIETRKDQMAALKWRIVDVEDEDAAAAEAGALVPGEAPPKEGAPPFGGKPEGDEEVDGQEDAPPQGAKPNPDDTEPPKPGAEDEEGKPKPKGKAPPFGAKMAKWGGPPFGARPGDPAANPFGAPPPPEAKAPPKKPRSKLARNIEKALRRPDGRRFFRNWQRELLEDLLVIDAPAIYISPRSHPDGAGKRAEVVDGATIKCLLDDSGRQPEPPVSAYQQILKGVVGAEYTSEELIYAPRNTRSNRVYGYSPVEQVVMTISIALRRQLSQFQYYSEGNIPEALAGVPDSWTPSQVEEFQAYWDSLMEGDTAARRHMKFLPGDLKVQFTKDPTLKDTFDEWLARIICYAFSLSPQALIAQMNRATAETASAQAALEGLEPLKIWFADLMNEVIERAFGTTDVQFEWEDEEIVDPKVKADVHVALVGAGILTKDEAREAYGKAPLVQAPPPGAPGAPPPGKAPLPGKQPLPGQEAAQEGQEDGEEAPEEAPPTAQEAPGGRGKAPPDTAAGAKAPTPPGGAQEPTPPEEAPPRRKAPAAKLAKAREEVQVANGDRKRPDPEAALQAVVQGWLTRLRDRLLVSLGRKARKLRKVDAADMEALLDRALTAKERERVREELGVEISRIASASAEEAMRSVGVTIDDLLTQADERAIEWALEHAGELMDDLSATTLDRVRTLGARAEEEGWTNDELATALSDDIAFAGSRAEMVARTETAFASVQGNLTGWRESGRVAAKRWTVGDGCCEECELLDGEEAPLDGAFSSGDDGPPAHPNCRCDVLPVLAEEPEDEE